MQKEELKDSLLRHKKHFASGETYPVKNRIKALKDLRASIERHEEDVYRALKADLGKSRDESYMCELGLVYSEISYMLKHVKKLSKEHTVWTPLAQFHSRSFTKPVPRGVVLIMSPWNYPLMLALDPLVDAIAAGNCAVVKPSAYAPETTKVLKAIIEDAFPSDYVSLVTGGREENQELLKLPFDYIFFTGSQKVGKVVLREASENLVPVSLELGGKSPCIVDETADLKLAARRIVFGKFLNCGQTCVAPDYLVVHENVKDEFLSLVRKEIERQFSSNPLGNDSYGKIINRHHYERLVGLFSQSRVLYGGNSDIKTLKIEPTLVGPVNWQSEVMEDEIFGPILPVMSYRKLDDVLEEINSRPHPLAFYIFSRNKENIRKVKQGCLFGGGCINDCIIHLATSEMGFGGVGASGMGSYHGKVGFETFSHRKSIVDKKTWIDLPMRYQPYTKFYSRIVKMFLH